MDEGYARVNQPKWYEEDLLTLQKYIRSQEYADLVNKLKWTYWLQDHMVL